MPRLIYPRSRWPYPALVTKLRASHAPFECLRTVCEWQANGAAADFELLVAATSQRDAVIFHFDRWPDADGRYEPGLARQAVLAA
jgi:hypothetical protein